jgi:hypothetical protein
MFALLRLVRVAALIALVAASAGCFATMGPSQERVACLNTCADDKDRCMLSARSADEIRWCDGNNTGCTRTCPP